MSDGEDAGEFPVDRTGHPVAMQAEKCDTCIFNPGNPMRLREGRVKEIVKANREVGTLLICHRTTYGQTEREAVCRGYYEAYGKKDHGSVVQVMERLFGPHWYEEVQL